MKNKSLIQALFSKNKKKGPKNLEWIDLDDSSEDELLADEDTYDEDSYDEGSYDEGSYDEDAYDEESYDEGSYDEGSYDEGSYDEDAYDEGSYDEDSYDEGSYDEDTYDEDAYDEDSYDKKADSIVSGDINAITSGISEWMSQRSTFDFAIIIGGVFVLILLVVAGTLYLKPSAERFKKAGDATENPAVTESAESQTEAEDVNSESSAETGDAFEEAVDTTTEDTDSDVHQVIEADDADDKATTVVMNLTSIQRDLKIKFIDNNTKSLVKGIEFEVVITEPSGSQRNERCKNADGVIHLTGLKAGAYKVSLTGPSDGSIRFLSDPVDINVKDVIEYRKVDVSSEIKKESEVDASKEDTGRNEAVEESTNSDTVEWVESTKKEVTEEAKTQTPGEVSSPSPSATLDKAEETTEFEEISKDDILNPAQALEENSHDSKVKYAPLPQDELPALDGDENDEESGKLNVIEIDINSENNVTPSSTPAPSGSPVASVSPSEAPSPATSDNSKGKTDSSTASPSISASPATATPNAHVENHDEEDEETEDLTKLTAEEKAQRDTDSVLTTNTGLTVYVKDGDTYREAAYADFYTYNKFYIKKKSSGNTNTVTPKETPSGQTAGNGSVSESPLPTTNPSSSEVVNKYTGWQTIDGYTYYFDKDGNKVTGEQVIQGAKYTFDSEGRLTSDSGTFGIDVSKWNGNINWTEVKNSGVQYAIIRCGYRGSTEGALIEDPMFRTNLNGARNAGIKVGVYFFTQAVDEIEAIEEASMVINLLGGAGLDYPVFVDVEPSKGRGDALSSQERTAVCEAFCRTIANSGYKAGIYASKNWLTEKMNISQLSNYTIWLSQYASVPTYSASRYDIWQYTSKGKIAGIDGYVDMNISFLKY